MLLLSMFYSRYFCFVDNFVMHQCRNKLWVFVVVVWAIKCRYWASNAQLHMVGQVIGWLTLTLDS